MSKYKNGEPCSHPGCLNHLTHPCEVCGRIGGVPPPPADKDKEGKMHCKVCGKIFSGNTKEDGIMHIAYDCQDDS